MNSRTWPPITAAVTTLLDRQRDHPVVVEPSPEVAEKRHAEAVASARLGVTMAVALDYGAVTATVQ